MERPGKLVQPPGAAARDLGRQRLPRPARDRRPHPPPAREARGAPRGAEPDPDRPRRGLPLPRAMSRRRAYGPARAAAAALVVHQLRSRSAVAALALLPPLQQRLRDQSGDRPAERDAAPTTRCSRRRSQDALAKDKGTREDRRSHLSARAPERAFRRHAHGRARDRSPTRSPTPSPIVDTRLRRQRAAAQRDLARDRRARSRDRPARQPGHRRPSRSTIPAMLSLDPGSRGASAVARRSSPQKQLTEVTTAVAPGPQRAPGGGGRRPAGRGRARPRALDDAAAPPRRACAPPPLRITARGPGCARPARRRPRRGRRPRPRAGAHAGGAAPPGGRAALVRRHRLARAAHAADDAPGHDGAARGGPARRPPRPRRRPASRSPARGASCGGCRALATELLDLSRLDAAVPAALGAGRARRARRAVARRVRAARARARRRARGRPARRARAGAAATRTPSRASCASCSTTRCATRPRGAPIHVVAGATTARRDDRGRRPRPGRPAPTSASASSSASTAAAQPARESGFGLGLAIGRELAGAWAASSRSPRTRRPPGARFVLDAADRAAVGLASRRRDGAACSRHVDPISPVPAARHLLRAKDLADARYAEPLDVATSPAPPRLSPAHFSREFRRAFGESPHAVPAHAPAGARRGAAAHDRPLGRRHLPVGRAAEHRLVHDELHAHRTACRRPPTARGSRRRPSAQWCRRASCAPTAARNTARFEKTAAPRRSSFAGDRSATPRRTR